jgi:hypothetical protein
MSWDGARIGRARRVPAGADRGALRAGWRIVIPGYPQWTWHQRERALVLLGSYLVAVGVGLFAWGTPVGLAVLAFAYGTHVASVSDVVRQQAFPGFGRRVPMVSAAGGLGLGLYLPAMAVATLFAWPGTGGGLFSDGYLVNCGAYRSALPCGGDWVWLRSSAWDQGRLARIVAGPGQEVAWSGEQLSIDGRPPPPGFSWRPRPRLVDLRFIVPGDHVLIAPASPESAGMPAAGPLLVARGQILGRAWARLYPIRERRFLR